MCHVISSFFSDFLSVLCFQIYTSSHDNVLRQKKETKKWQGNVQPRGAWACRTAPYSLDDTWWTHYNQSPLVSAYYPALTRLTHFRHMKLSQVCTKQPSSIVSGSRTPEVSALATRPTWTRGRVTLTKVRIFLSWNYKKDINVLA